MSWSGIAPGETDRFDHSLAVGEGGRLIFLETGATGLAVLAGETGDLSESWPEEGEEESSDLPPFLAGEGVAGVADMIDPED